MRPPFPPALVLMTAMLALAAGGCATTGDTAADAAPQIPVDAVATVRPQTNGDIVTEYRVAGQLRVVKVQPKRGPAYYLQDRNGDGRVDEERGVSPVYFKLFEW